VFVVIEANGGWFLTDGVRRYSAIVFFTNLHRLDHLRKNNRAEKFQQFTGMKGHCFLNLAE
jgi:hypothetical protein